MELKPDFERFRTAVQHQESDRVPFYELLVDYGIQSRFIGREVIADDIKSQVEFWASAGYDFIPITVGMMEPGGVTKESAISKVIEEIVLEDEEEAEERQDPAWNLEYHSFIKDHADFEAFPWDVLAELNYDKFEDVKQYLPDGMKVIAVSGKIFTLTWMLMGFNHFALSLTDDKTLVADVFNRVAEIQYQSLTKVLSMDHIGAVWTVDDIAMGNGPMIMPEIFREFLFPSYQKMARMCHDSKRIFGMHTDGDITKLMGDLIDIGIDVLHPIDPTCMDIHKMKKDFGDQICLAGNVSNEMLQIAEPADIEARVKDLLRDIAPGGGYLLAAGNSVPSWAKFENYKAMIDAGLKYGRYPIQI
jgi:uroporphyrinogen decarboxylase